jgi:signal transduction histidine kinase
MIKPLWLRDSITRRFALAIGATAAVCIGLNLVADSMFGGPACRPPAPAWQLEQSTQLVLRVGILVFSIVAVSLVGAARLARPIAAFAAAARRFGTDPNAAPMPPQGPAEMQMAIAAFNTMQSQIQRFVTSQAAMFAAISHDLRTPLTRMRLRGEFIEDRDQQARLFRDVDEMQAMVSAVLLFLRDRTADEATTSLDLAELLRSIADDYVDSGSNVDYIGPLHVAFPGRPVGLRRAFENLIDNAVKYGIEPTISLQCRNAEITVTIDDHGPGIPAVALEDVFAPFRRLEPSRNHHTGGMGLRLTSARAGFRAHGGDVVLSNMVGGGLRATVVLPLLSPARRAAQTDA